MKVVGLVTEYNPFHNGHLHHLKASLQAAEATHSIAVMSGHFLQRGEPALLDKWTRAKNAVESGVDLVIELPTLFACSSAEYFAFGAVSLLKDLNIVDVLCFGSEQGQLDHMSKIAHLLNTKDPILFQYLEEGLAEGLSYPKARALAIEKTFDDVFEFKPNNILGLEYVKAIESLAHPFMPMTIKRVHADYMSEALTGHIASATGIRKQLSLSNDTNFIKDFVPLGTYRSISNDTSSLIFPKHLSDILLYKIRTSDETYLRTIHDVTEGLEARIKKAAASAYDYSSLLQNIMTKRYTQTRIQRVLIKILLDIKKDDLKNCGDTKPLYARILAFNDQGKELIKKIKKTTQIPLITNINKIQLKESAHHMLSLDIKATNVYNLLYPTAIQKTGGNDYIKQPEYVKTL